MTLVYVMSPKTERPCKIGISADPVGRLATVQTGCSEKLILWSAWTPEHLDAREIERRAHAHFAEHRLKGEWFDISVAEAERFIGSVEAEFDGFRWITTHSCGGGVRIFDGGGTPSSI